jgi:cyclomaltodextrinase / maltogenic alpha-amylase / neopullulanase
LGEVVHGDYARWANPAMLDSVTNYEAFKGLWSSLADANYFEIAYALERQSGAGGIYRDLPLYNFADNHDVDRVASQLPRAASLHPLHCLLFTMPGVPSIYAGSEWGIEGVRRPGDDSALRPALDLASAPGRGRAPELAATIGRLARVRAGSVALRRGGYRQLHVAHEQLAFLREAAGERVVVALNASEAPAALDLPVTGSAAVDLLDHGERLPIVGGRLRTVVPPSWARVLRVE